MLLLTLSVVLVVSLSIASRSVTETATGTYEEEALRAFSAAEAGVEELLNKRAPAAGTIVTSDPGDFSSSNAEYSATSNYNSPGSEYEYPNYLLPGESAVFWLVGRDGNDNLTCSAPYSCFRRRTIRNVCWGIYPDGDYTIDSQPAIEMSVYYDGTQAAVSGTHDYSGIKVARIAYDPYSGRGNNFETGNVHHSHDCTINGTRYRYNTQSEINFQSDLRITACDPGNDPGCLIAIVIKVLYNNSKKPEKIAIRAGQDLPPQGVAVSSTGSSGDTNRKIEVLKTFSAPPHIFESALFSYGSISK